MTNITIRGLSKLKKRIESQKNATKNLDPAIRVSATRSLKRIVRTTPKDTGETAKRWSRVMKIKNSVYKIENDAKTDDNRYNIINILNKGRKKVVPVKSKFLYIPLNTRARKKLGAPIPKGLKFGVDYVLAKSSKAVKGKFFIEKQIKKSTKEMTKLVIKELRKNG